MAVAAPHNDGARISRGNNQRKSASEIAKSTPKNACNCENARNSNFSDAHQWRQRRWPTTRQHAERQLESLRVCVACRELVLAEFTAESLLLMFTETQMPYWGDKEYRCMTGVALEEFNFIFTHFCGRAPLQTRSVPADDRGHCRVTDIVAMNYVVGGGYFRHCTI